MDILDICLCTTDSVVTRNLKFQAERWVNEVNDVNVMHIRHSFMTNFIQFLERCDNDLIELNIAPQYDIKDLLFYTVDVSKHLIKNIPIVRINLENIDENNIHRYTHSIFRESDSNDNWIYYNKNVYVLDIKQIFDCVNKTTFIRPHNEFQSNVYIINDEGIVTGRYIKAMKFKEVFNNILIPERYHLNVAEIILSYDNEDSHIYVTKENLIDDMNKKLEDVYEIVYGEDEDIENLHIDLKEFKDENDEQAGKE